MSEDPRAPVPSGAAFLAGVLTVSVILLLFATFVVVRLGPAKSGSRARDTLLKVTGQKTERVLELPTAIRDELRSLGAVVDNAGNPTAKKGEKDHDSILVRPDERFGWVLRPGVAIEAAMLRARNPFNLDPPVVYLPARSSKSPELERYLQQNTRLRYAYTTGADGRRSTLPAVEAERAILVVGDSVAFGEGVDDANTVASLLQRQLGEGLRVVNTGVGGYSGLQVLEVARAEAAQRRYEALVYLTSENDFMVEEGRGYREVAEEVFGGLGELRERFSGRLVVVVVSYLETVVEDLMRGEGWTAEMIQRSADLYAALPEIATRNGFAYLDWREIVADETRRGGSIFARMALYVDHGHLSPRGGRKVVPLLLDALGGTEVFGAGSRKNPSPRHERSSMSPLASESAR